MNKRLISIQAIDAQLPQTQCGLCKHDGCRPYAQAIATGEDTINHCPPGGLETLEKLGQLLNIDIEPYREEAINQTKPLTVAKIDEAECIGCTKCIQACPVDAIFGSNKTMHVVLTDQCTGCDLCLDPCPVDCIDMVPIKKPSAFKQQQKADQYRQHYQFRQQRLAKQNLSSNRQHKRAKLVSTTEDETKLNRQQAIKAAIERERQRRQHTK